MKLAILNRSGERVPRKFIEHWFKELSRELKREKLKLNPKLDFTLVFVTNSEIRKLNKTYRSKDYATDVLSFEGDGTDTFGELVIAPKVIKRQAKEHELSFEDELGYMILHGILHLLGFDHEKSAKNAKRMFAIQDRIFQRLSR